MKAHAEKEPMIFDIHVTEGSHYEVGKQRAITFKESYPDDIAYFISPMEGRDYNHGMLLILMLRWGSKRSYANMKM
ncbi:hypothetical protein [Paenibacillus azoreducens]|uniref:Uncharacterized protein n=1 Tax=Paenibacillus azoreducens TaxID=116718 RepID=A0A919YJW3_9BACL|nr:hypothetical protein [Paenibacillus azoreducens]GIO50010.1 hypothetical protein J34TS1_47750 [Paenibacillus azoreducens]